MTVIGITGGIACGKSTVCAFLQEQGATIIDADQLVHAQQQQGAKGYEAIRAAFGEGYVLPNGALDRKKLAELIFSNPNAKKQLEGILHPAVMAQMKEEIACMRADGASVCVLEIPLLFETNSQTLCDEVWVCHLPEQMQIARLMARDGLTADQALARVQSQMPLEQKMARAHRLIDTGNSIEQTGLQTLAHLYALQKERCLCP